MKKTIFAVLVTITISQLCADRLVPEIVEPYFLELSVELETPDFSRHEYRNGNPYQTIRQSQQAFQPGSPDLPALSTWLLVPNSTRPHLSVNPGDPVVWENIDLAPVQIPQQDSQNITPDFFIDHSIYGRDLYFPSEFAHFEEVRQKRGQDCILLWVQPYQYNPGQRTLRYYPDLSVRIDFLGVAAPLPPNLEGSNISYYDFALNSEAVLREENAVSFRNTDDYREQGADIIIVTAPEFRDAAEVFASWKLRLGLTCDIIDTDQLGYDPVAIDNYVTDAYNNWETAPSYLILLGDAEHVPTWYENAHVSGGDQGHTAADMYYADINDPPDLMVDLGFGRIPVETVIQAENFVQALIDYERNPPDDELYYNWATAACYFQDNDGNSIADRRFAKTSEDIRNFLLNDYDVERIYYTGWDITPLYWNDNDYVFENDEPMAEIPVELQRPNFAWDGNAFDVINAVNRGTYFLYHRDHGFRQGWGDPYFDINHVDMLSNGELRPVVWTINCCTGWFDNETDDDVCDTSYNSESFVEYWVRHTNGGSVGLIGATRISFSGYNDRLAWGLTDAIWPGFLEWCNVNYNDHYPIYRMGDVLTYAKEYMMSNYQNSDYRTTAVDEFSWFGDPSMKIWTSQPQELVVSHDQEIILGSTEFSVDCDVEGALAVLINDNDILAKGTVFNGSADLEFQQLNSLGTIELCISAHDYTPYMTELDIIAVGPYVVCDSVYYQEDGDYNDGSLQSLDMVNFDITLKNIGIDPSSEELQLILTTDSEYVSIISGETDTTGLGPDETILIDNAFRIELLAGLQDGDEIDFTVEISSDNETWYSPLILDCNGPGIEFLESLVTTVSGEDAILDPGESAEIDLLYINNGNGFSYSLTTTLLCYDPYATVSGTDIIPVISPGEQSSTLVPFQIDVSEECPVDYYLTLEIFAYDLMGTVISEQFEIPIGFLEQNFEDGEEIWYHENLGEDYLDEWHLSDYRNSTPGGVYSMKCGGEGAIPYSNNVLAALYMPEIDLSGGIMITFSHWMDTNLLPGGQAHDGGIIEISIDGSEFEQIEPIGGYPAVSLSIPNLPFPPDTPLFAGSIDWEEVQLDLTSYSGMGQIRLVFGSSTGLSTGEGWYVDDFHIINYQTSTDDDLLPVRTCLAQNYPNPFNPETVISFQLSKPAEIMLSVYNIKGQLVKILKNDMSPAGVYSLSWDGKNDQGKSVDSGIYFYRLETGSKMFTRKMILLK